MIKKLKKQQSLEELDITSLLDILVVLLIFLLQNLATSDLTLDLVGDLKLPVSKSIENSQNVVTLQVNRNYQATLDNEKMGMIQVGSEDNGPLTQKLAEVANTFKEGTERQINLVFDKTLKYHYIDFVMKLIAQSGFTNFNLIILKEE